MRRGLAVAVSFAIFVGSLLASERAEAQSTTRETMREEMHEHFDGEAAGSWGFGTAGVVSLTGAGLGLFAANDRLFHGAAFPMAAVGLIQLGAGLVLGLRTHGQVVERGRDAGDGRDGLAARRSLRASDGRLGAALVRLPRSPSSFVVAPDEVADRVLVGGELERPAGQAWPFPFRRRPSRLRRRLVKRVEVPRRAVVDEAPWPFEELNGLQVPPFQIEVAWHGPDVRNVFRDDAAASGAALGRG